ncbi:MAG TPA: hypothetical protein VM782_21665, partial [Stellaceae bacterium]|nr:hypothetical protein [Stellaceae bacterium]
TFAQFDLLVFTPAEIDGRTVTAEQVQRVADAVHEGAFVKFGPGIYPKSDFIDEQGERRQKIGEDDQRRAQDRAKAKEDFQKRDGDAVSAIYLKTPASAVCFAGETEGRLARRVKAADSPFADMFGDQAQYREALTAESIFLAIKQNQCLAAVAPTKVLRDVIKGLDRDGILFDYHGGTL